MKFGFFGTSRFSVIVLESLKSKGVYPEFIVTGIDKPQGRKMIITPSPVKTWAIENQVPVHQFNSLKNYRKNKNEIDAFTSLSNLHEQSPVDFYLVASYGLLIPDNILYIPKHKTLNIHPSLLPLYRGASPLQSSILDDQKYTGVTIIVLDSEMDHGPVVAQKEIDIETEYTWPIAEEALEEILATEGAGLLLDSVEEYLDGTALPIPQNHSKATYTKKFAKEDGFIDLDSLKTEEDAYKALLKTYAFSQWPGTFTFVSKKTKEGEKKLRVKILGAKIVAGKYTPTKVIPEGGKEMNYDVFLKSLLSF